MYILKIVNCDLIYIDVCLYNLCSRHFKLYSLITKIEDFNVLNIQFICTLEKLNSDIDFVQLLFIIQDVLCIFIGTNIYF